MLAAESRIRVLHVLPWVVAGGVERRRVVLARHLGPAFEQRVACLTARGPIRQELLDRGVPVDTIGHDGGGITTLRTHARLHAIVREFRPHILHAAIIEGMVLGGIAGLVQRVPVVLLEETSFPSATLPDAEPRSAKMRAVVRWLSTLTDGIVAVAPAIGRYLEDEVGVPRAKIHVVANGVEDIEVASVDEIREERRRLGFPPGSFVLGGVGRIFERYKRFGDLLFAVRELRKQHDVRALVVGDGVDLEALKRRARDLGIEDEVVFAGRREDHGLFFGVMDCFVLSSATEAAPLALMEAMLAGRPCVATTVGGVPDIAVDGESALLVPPNDPVRLLGAIRRVVEDEALRRRLSDGGRARGLARFTATRYASDLRDLYVRRLVAHGVTLPSA